jgi:phosphate transport system permease protein
MVDKATAIAGPALKWASIGIVIVLLVYQILQDVKAHGAAGLVGPIEIAALAYGLIRLISTLAKGTSFWIVWRKIVHWSMYLLVSVCSFVGCFALGFLLVFVINKGFHAINLNFFTKPPGAPDDVTGGMLNGIVGTGLLVLIASGVGIPLGVLGGIFLAEFRTSKLVPYVRFCADVLNGIPSVVMGIFGYALFVLPFHRFSAIAGGLTLGLMMVPTIVRTTEEMLRLVPNTIREASWGLGATKVRTIMTIVVPAASSGIVTGILLSVARVAGETAPLLFTAFGNDQVSTKLDQPISSMTLEIYNNFAFGGPAEVRAWAGSLVLLMMVLVISILARLATRKKYALK